MSQIYLHREEIYKQVWERPMRQVAQDYGISDVGLKKACRRLGVPTPPVGFWAKRDAGQKVRIPPLPPLRDDDREVVVIRPPVARPDVGPLPNPAIRVPKRLHKPHPVVQQSLDELKRARVDDYGRASPLKPKGLVVRVSPAQLSRALRIAEALVRALERLGATVEPTPHFRDEMRAEALIEGEHVAFSIWEPSGRKKVRIESRWSSYDRYTYTPHGKLELRIDEYVSSGQPKAIRETGSKPIEQELGRFIQSMYATARVLRARRLEREEEDRRREERRRERERIEREEAYQEWLRRDLVKLARAHDEANVVRAFLGAVRADPRYVVTQEQKLWIEWALEQAEAMDPISRGEDPSRPLAPPEGWEPKAKESHVSGKASVFPGAFLRAGF